jgi:hypothetical protein
MQPEHYSEEEPELERVIEEPVSGYCCQHTDNMAAHRCSLCGKEYCDMCVNSRKVGSLLLLFCRSCGGRCNPTSARLPVQNLVIHADTFFHRLPEAFGYPFKKNGLIMLVGGAVFLTLVDLVNIVPVFGMVLGLVFSILAAGYMSAYFLSIITCSAAGNESPPPWPDLHNAWDDALRPYFLVLGTVLLCFGPALLYSLLGEDARITWVLLGAGMFYLPMALLGVAMFDSIGGVIPMLVIPSIIRLPAEYTVACVIMGTAFAVALAGQVLAGVVPLVGGLMSNFIGLCLLFLEARVLGLLYHSNSDKLGWF